MKRQFEDRAYISTLQYYNHMRTDKTEIDKQTKLNN